jgi:hypothetical protein
MTAQSPTGSTVPVRLRMRPDRICVTVNQATNRSAVSFLPADAGTPITHDADPAGATAMQTAKQISAAYPGCPIDGPHFHTPRPQTRRAAGRMGRKPTTPGRGDE